MHGAGMQMQLGTNIVTGCTGVRRRAYMGQMAARSHALTALRALIGAHFAQVQAHATGTGARAAGAAHPAAGHDLPAA